MLDESSHVEWFSDSDDNTPTVKMKKKYIWNIWSINDYYPLFQSVHIQIHMIFIFRKEYTFLCTLLSDLHIEKYKGISTIWNCHLTYAIHFTVSNNDALSIILFSIHNNDFVCKTIRGKSIKTALLTPINWSNR